MRRALWAGATLAAACSGPGPAQGPNAAEALPWLVGAWHHVEADAITEERWTKAPDGSLLGAGRVLVRGTILGFAETLHIGSGPQGLTLTTWVQGQEPVQFVADGLGDDTVTFRNAGHDFPDAITYHRTPQGGLEAKATGKNPDGSPREEAWTLTAGPAPVPAQPGPSATP